jgi:hypothetical protein
MTSNPLWSEEGKLARGDPAAGILQGFRQATDELREAIKEAREPVTDDELRRSMAALVAGASVHFRTLGIEAIRRNVLLIMAILLGSNLLTAGTVWLLRGAIEPSGLVRAGPIVCQQGNCWLPIEKP